MIMRTEPAVYLMVLRIFSDGTRISRISKFISNNDLSPDDLFQTSKYRKFQQVSNISVCLDQIMPCHIMDHAGCIYNLSLLNNPIPGCTDWGEKSVMTSELVEDWELT